MMGTLTAMRVAAFDDELLCELQMLHVLDTPVEPQESQFDFGMTGIAMYLICAGTEVVGKGAQRNVV